MSTCHHTHEKRPMTANVFEIQGFTIVLNKVVFLTRVFSADDGEGFQFNIRFGSDLRLSPRFATRHEAELHRGLLVKALNDT